MNDFYLIWQISPDSNGVQSGNLTRLFFSIAILIIGIFIAFATKDNYHCHSNKKRSPYSILIVGVIFSVASTIFYLFDAGGNDMLYDAFINNEYKTVEGEVHVFHEQRAMGHSKGDIIEIDHETFVIDAFYRTAAYKKIIAHGGALKEGVYARIRYLEKNKNGHILSELEKGKNRSILSVEIRK